MYACLAVTCHLHFWQNDRNFLRATVVTRGWNGYRNKSQHRKSTLEKKILPPFQQGFEPATFQSRVRRSNHWAIPAPFRCQCTSPQLYTVCVVTCGEPSSSPNCVCAGRRSRPTTLFLSVLHWRITLNLLQISFDGLICRRISPVCVVSVTTRAGDWRWTQPHWYLPPVWLPTARICLLPRSIVPVSVSAHVPGVQLPGPAVLPKQNL